MNYESSFFFHPSNNPYFPLLYFNFSISHHFLKKSFLSHWPTGRVELRVGIHLLQVISPWPTGLFQDLAQVGSSPVLLTGAFTEGETELHSDWGNTRPSMQPIKISHDLVPKVVVPEPWEGQEGTRQGARAGSEPPPPAPRRARPPSGPPWVTVKGSHCRHTPSIVLSPALSSPPKPPRPPECTLTTSL